MTPLVGEVVRPVGVPLEDVPDVGRVGRLEAEFVHPEDATVPLGAVAGRRAERRGVGEPEGPHPVGDLDGHPGGEARPAGEADEVTRLDPDRVEVGEGVLELRVVAQVGVGLGGVRHPAGEPVDRQHPEPLGQVREGPRPGVGAPAPRRVPAVEQDQRLARPEVVVARPDAVDVDERRFVPLDPPVLADASRRLAGHDRWTAADPMNPWHNP